jgi:mono/diheme cytochrome c family protein
MKTVSIVALLLALSRPAPALAAETASASLTFEQHVRPLFKAYCFDCHGEGEKLKGGLDLRLRRLIATGGNSGAAIVPGKRDESLLYEKISQHEMPPGKTKLSQEQVAVIGRWIEAGARTSRPEPVKVDRGLLITSEERSFWAFQPIRRPSLPRVKDTSRLRTPIDAFLQAKLEDRTLTFSPDAAKENLVRRAYFDLLGLPPAPGEVASFVADTSPDAYERLIDGLLASPHYGERWGRHWLDVAGYADSEGYTSVDPVRPFAYKYRDYVVRSLNADKSFDRFIQEQLAGDEMVRPPYRNLSAADIDKLVATGFLRMAPDGTASGGVDHALARNQVMAETIKIVSTSLFGLTVGCAQCHNHRYDPIPQADYYRLRAIFEPAYNVQNWRAPMARRISLYTDADRKKAAGIEAEAAKIDIERLKKTQEYIDRTFEKELAKRPETLRTPIRVARKTVLAKRTAAQNKLLKENPSVNVSAGSLYLYDAKAAAELKKIADRAAKVRATKPVEEYLRALTEVPGQTPATHLFYRGDHTQPKQALLPGELTVLASAGTVQISSKSPSLPTTGRRLAYARWLTSGKHPLTARVLVNRVWMHHFGRGIVGTPGDFGFLGERPSHPELLDWLADDFMAGGWRLKRLHKLIMMSTAYRQSSRREPRRTGSLACPLPAGVSASPGTGKAACPTETVSSSRKGAGAVKADAIDPDNRLLWRMSLRRLDAESVRDTLLAVAGKLNPKMFGPAVPVMEDEVGQFVIGIENKNGENRPGPIIPMHGEDFRRSVYVQARRSRPLAMLDTFDAPVMDPNCAARASSTVTPQSLMLMNSELIVTQASYFAQRLRDEAGLDPRAQVTRAWQLAFGVNPSSVETSDAVAFLAQQTAHFGKKVAVKAAGESVPQQQALASCCQVLISSNRFLYID